MKSRFHFYATGIAPLIAATSPGIALHEELPATTSTTSTAVLEPSVESQNAMLRARARVYDRVLDAFPSFGSGAGTSVDRVWYEAASHWPIDEHIANRVTQDVAGIVAEIRSAFSLQVKELAEVLGVERPTVYAWLRGDSKPQSANRVRLGEILQVVAIWKRQSDLPIGKAVRDHLDENGRSLLDELKTPTLDAKSIARRMRLVKQNASASPAKKKSILEMADELGFDMSKVREREDVLDAISGKRTHED